MVFYYKTHDLVLRPSFQNQPKAKELLEIIFGYIYKHLNYKTHI